MYHILYRWIACSIRYQSPVLIFTKHEALITPNHFHWSTLAKFAPTNFWLTQHIRTTGKSRHCALMTYVLLAGPGFQRSWQIVHMNFFQYASGLQAVQYWPGRLVIALRTALFLLLILFQFWSDFASIFSFSFFVCTVLRCCVCIVELWLLFGAASFLSDRPMALSRCVAIISGIVYDCLIA